MNIRRVFYSFLALVLIGSMFLPPVAAMAQEPDSEALMNNNASTDKAADDELALKAKEEADRGALEAAAALRPAPVGSRGITALILEEDFETWPPAGWSIVNNGGDCAWQSTATTTRPNYAGGDGEAADADSDKCGSGTTMDTELWTPAMDLTPYGGATLQFIAAYNDIGSGGDTFDVDVSSNGGTSWTNVLRWDEDHSAYGPGELVSIDLSPYTSNNVVVRFYYYGATYDWWAEVDQVRVFPPSADFSTSYKLGPSVVAPGELLTYTVALSNTGNLSATNATLLDPIPTDTTFDHIVSPAAASYNAGQNRVEWTGTVTNADAVSVTFVVNVDGGVACGSTITNTATISDPEALDMVTVTATTDVPAADLSTSVKSSDPLMPAPGGVMTYTVSIVNSGGCPATGVTLEDPIPLGATYAYTVTPGLVYNSGEGRIEWGGAVPGADQVDLTFAVNVTAGCGEAITNTAFISATELPATLEVEHVTRAWDVAFYAEDFESENGGFTVSGTNASWDWGDVGPYGGTRPDFPAGAHTGAKAWGTNLTGDYNLSEEAYLTSPAIDLSSAVNVPGFPLYLEWWQWMYNESATYDWGEVEARGGSTGWTLLDPPGRMGGAQDTDWASYLADISQFAGVSDFQVRFHFHSDGSVVYPGWYVDDLSIQQCEPPSDLYLSPDTLEVAGCVGVLQRHDLSLTNWTGSDGTFNLSYSLTEPSWGTIEGPASLFLANETGASFAITITPEVCLPDGLQLFATVEASGNGYDDTTYITKTVTTKGNWTFRQAMPTPRGDLAVVSGGDGGLYAIGGTTSGGTPNGENERYDIAADTWATKTAMPTGLTIIDGGQVGGVIYVPGGYDGTSFVATTLAYSTTAETWTTVAAAPRAVAAYAVATCGGLLYRSGGAEQATFPNGTTALEVYDPASNAWTSLASMEHGHTWHAMTCIGGKLYVAGGLDESGGESPVAEVYDIATNTWSDAAMADLPATWWGSADLIKHDQMVMAGGIVGGSTSAEVIVYDPVGDSWSSGAPLQDARFRLEGDYAVDSGYADGGWEPVWTPHGSNEYLVQCPTCSQSGWLDGHVLDTAASGVPCTDAAVHVEPGGLDVSVDATGYYTVELVPFDYDVSASAVDYPEPDGPYPVTVIQDVITTQDFGLDRPDVEVDPLALSAEAIHPNAVTQYFTVTNVGTYELEWEIREVAPTTVLNAMSTAVDAAGGSAKSRALVDASDIEVEPQLLDELAADETTGYLIYFRERPDLSPAFEMDWLERGRFVTKALQETAELSQARVRARLDAQGAEYQAFWIDNVIAVESSNQATFNSLLEFPEIAALRARRVMQVIEPVDRSGPAAPLAIEPNISHVNADQVWGLGIHGEGMVVANIDTGVRYTHETLEPHYRGNLGGGSFDHDYNWLGAADGDAVPTDDHGHGSHTMGTMIGDDGGTNQIGMAPGAKWIACDGCSTTGCPDTALLTCAQWVAAPYPIGDPGSPDPDKRPNVVNNSWGDCGTSYDNWYQGSVDSWHAAGIYPVFSNGNASNCGYSEPPGCNTVGNPARYGNVTGVGSTGQSNGQYATHSNWGPTDNPDTVNPNGYPSLKPQVLAPGVNIRSSLNGSDSDYASWGGTSMSSPHVSGLVALMWSAAPCLVGDYATTETILEETAVPIPYASGCGGEGPGDVPNMATGWGEIDAYAAVEGAMDYCGADWLEWVSTDPISGTISASGDQRVDVTFTCTTTATQQTQPLHGTLRVLHNDPCEAPVDVDLTFFCISPTPMPNWEKAVEINGQPVTPVAGPHEVRPGDIVVVVDRVGATYSETITSALTETWSTSLDLLDYDAGGVGVVTEGDHLLRWDLVGVAQNTFYPITKTFEVLYGAWTTDTITESYRVEGAVDQPDDVVVTLEHYVPAMSLEKSGPATAWNGQVVELTLTVLSDGSFRGTALMTDTLPAGMTYAGNLAASFGNAWEAANVIHWTNVVADTSALEWPQAINVGVLSPDGDSMQDLVDLINGMSGMTAARITGDLSTMTLGDLLPYNLIVTSNNNKWGDAGGNPNIGNILADYVDSGGKIIMADFAWDNVGWELTGRIMADGYTPYQTATGDQDNTTLGSYDNTHPVMQGVTDMSLSGSVTHQSLPLETGADWIADWADGTPCVYAQGTDVLGFNFLLDWGDPGWPWAGDVPTLLENSINWLMSSAAPPMPATVTVTFNVEVTGSLDDVIHNTAQLDWTADWTDAVHDVTVVERTDYFFYLPVVYKNY